MTVSRSVSRLDVGPRAVATGLGSDAPALPSPAPINGPRTARSRPSSHHPPPGAEWFYSVPALDNSCQPAKKLYEDYLGAVKHGNIFSLDVGPDYNGKLRDIDVKTLHEVGQMIRGEITLPAAK